MLDLSPCSRVFVQHIGGIIVCQALPDALR
jgi:hypothetical protein